MILSKSHITDIITVLIGRVMKEISSADYDWKLLKKAELTHDICRTQKEHAKAGADVLRKEGYEEIAELVEGHHSSEDFGGMDSGKRSVLSEKELLFYADKRVQEEKVVSLKERFEGSVWKCRTPEAREKHHRLYEKAREIERKIENLVGGKDR